MELTDYSRFDEGMYWWMWLIGWVGFASIDSIRFDSIVFDSQICTSRTRGMRATFGRSID